MHTDAESLLPHQREAIRVATSGTPGELVRIATVGGFASGKTEACVGLALAVGEANAPVVMIEPEPNMIDDILVPTFRRVLERRGITEGAGWRYVRATRTIEVHLDDGATLKILLLSGEDVDHIAPISAGAVIIDEADMVSREVLGRALAAARHPEARHQVFFAVGTMEGRQPDEPASAFYRFATAPGTHLIRASTLANVHLPGGPGRFVADYLGHLAEDETRRLVYGHLA